MSESARAATQEATTCRICDVPLRANNQSGVCKGRTKACRAERNRMWWEGASVEQRSSRAEAQRASFSELSAERRARRNALARGWYAKNPRTRMLIHARKNGLEQGVPVTITVADIAIPPACPVCDVPLATGDGSGPTRSSPSLDRYEPCRGYVPGNIMVICADCNRRKQNHTGWQLVQLGLAVIAAKAAYDEQSPYHGLLSGEPLLFGGESAEVVEEYRRLVGAAETAARLRPPPFPTDWQRGKLRDMLQAERHPEDPGKSAEQE